MHELFVIKIYNYKLQLKTKINMLLYKAYEVAQGKNHTEHLLNTKENFNFFNSLHQGDYRASKICRMIKVNLYFIIGYFN